MPIKRAYVYSLQIQKWQNICNITRRIKHCEKNDLHTLQSECEILKLGKNNLRENIANQDEKLEEKLREGKINQKF